MSDATQTDPQTCEYCGEVHESEPTATMVDGATVLTGSLGEILDRIFGTGSQKPTEERTEEPWEAQERKEAEEISTLELRVIVSALDMVGGSMGSAAREALTKRGDLVGFMRIQNLMTPLAQITTKLNRLVAQDATMVRLPF